LQRVSLFGSGGDNVPVFVVEMAAEVEVWSVLRVIEMQGPVHVRSFRCDPCVVSLVVWRIQG
jgi:hypothetical protein